jgi:hypothetical protein
MSTEDFTYEGCSQAIRVGGGSETPRAPGTPRQGGDMKAGEIAWYWLSQMNTLTVFPAASPRDVRKVSDFPFPAARLMGLRPAAGTARISQRHLAEGSAFPYIEGRSHRL